MQLTNETALPIAWIEAEGDSWGCDEEDCEYGEVRIIYIYSNTVIICLDIQEDNSAWNECDNYYWETRTAPPIAWIEAEDEDAWGDEDFSAVVTECYEDKVDPEEWGTDKYEFPERKMETFMDVSGFVFDKYNASTYEVHTND